jgi:hypothetical protein
LLCLGRIDVNVRHHMALLSGLLSCFIVRLRSAGADRSDIKT